MEKFIIALLPIIVTLFIAFRIKNVFLALISGIIVSSSILTFSSGDYFVGFNAVANVFQSTSFAKTTFFIFSTGALMSIVNKSGGVEGLIIYCTETQKIVKSRLGAQLISFVLGLLLFVDGTSSIVVTALVGKPFFNKYDLPREKLALISNSTGSAVAWLIPFGAAGAFLTGVLNNTLINIGVETNAFSIVVSSVFFHFYGIALFITIVVSILFNIEIGSIKRVTNSYEESKVFEHQTSLPEGKKPLARNMVAPILILLTSIFTILYITGEGNLMLGDGSTAVFVSGILTIFISGVYYMLQGIVKLDDYVIWCFEGMKLLFEIILILVLATAFSSLIGHLGTAGYLAQITNYVPKNVIIIAALAVSVLISYSTGSSGAAVALLIPIIVPIAYSMQIPLQFVIGAIISGAVFGDQNSPISDSVILTSTVTNVKIMDHVKTQLPYTLIALGISFIGFVLLGLFV